jgi:hypothetical protein
MNAYKLDPAYLASLRRFPVGSILGGGLIVVFFSYIAVTDHLRKPNGLPVEGGILATTVLLGMFGFGVWNMIKKRRLVAESRRQHTLTIEGRQLRFTWPSITSTVEVADVRRVLVQRDRGKIQSFVLELRYGEKLKLANYEHMDKIIGDLLSLIPNVAERMWWHLHF